jgi:hypothetical protein
MSVTPRTARLCTCVALACALGTAGAAPGRAARAAGRQVEPTATQTVTYQEDSSNFPNPERGFYRQLTPMWTGEARFPLSSSALAAYRSEGITLLRAYYLIDEFRSAPLSSAALNAITADLAAVRTAGIKIILRFAYNFPANEMEMLTAMDAPLSRVRGHIQQLAPVLQTNADVIAFVEAGFIGAWGEWHHSSNALIDEDHSTNAASREIVDQLLAALPARRTIALRYPYHKQEFYGSAPLAPAEAFSGTGKARVGAHNDCFLANDIDGGTYSVPPNFEPQIEATKQYLHDDNRFVPQGGETCAADAPAQPYIGCPNALVDLGRMRWSAINIEYHPGVIARWQSDGCLDEVRRRLGFRLRLVSAALPTEVRQGRALTIEATLANSGFAAPYNARDVELVLRRSGSGALHRFTLAIDPRFWLGGQTHLLTGTVTLPGAIEPGSYQMLLNLPDPEPALRPRPEYSVRLANVGTWEPATGFNNLLATLTVTEPSPFTDPVLLSAATPVRAVHITELRARIDSVRAGLGLPGFSWTDSSLPGVAVKGTHIIEMRTALNQAYAAAGAPAPTYTDASLASGVTAIRAVHISELRAAVVALE